MFANSYQVYMNYVDSGQNGGTMEQLHTLELISVSHSGPIVPPNKQSLWSRLTGSGAKGLILKEVSLQLHSGEMMAVLGSKGSGKRALLEVIAHRTSGESATKGQILMNDVPLTARLFEEQCGFVCRRTSLIHGLTVRQHFHYMAQMCLRTSSSLRRARVKQVLADLGLIGCAQRRCEQLGESEKRRLAIGLQLVRDPLLLVLDEPTAGLDPLHTFFVLSMLSTHARKHGRLVLLTLDNPRSDIFPFLDRVTYLCLGDVVYSGSTALMIDYFRSIGFPCPELENPLMYYLCLSTVDRRSRERFIESSAQIAALVDKFRLEGERYRKQRTPLSDSPTPGGQHTDNRSAAPLPYPSTIPLTAYGRPSSMRVLWALIGRQISASLSAGGLFRRLLLLPLSFLLLSSALLPRLELYQHSLQTRAFLLFNCMAVINCVSAPAAAYQLAAQRDRYYEESSRLRLYRGPLLVLSQILANLPFDLLSVGVASAGLYWLTPLRLDALWAQRWAVHAATYWALHTLAQQVTIALLCVVRSRFLCSLLATALLNVLLVAGSGLLRNTLSTSGSWLSLLNHANPFYYASWTVQFNEFHNNPLLDRLPALGDDLHSILPCPANVVPGRCLYLNGTHFLAHRYREGVEASKQLLGEFSLHFWRNFALLQVLVLAVYAINSVLYVVPLPASLKAKFRD